jgi:hypothetical protein
MRDSHTVGRPAIVFPLNDPGGVMLPHLDAILPVLKQVFSKAYISVTHDTSQSCLEQMGRLREDRFFTLFDVRTDSPVGDQFSLLYRQTALAVPPAQVLHLCFIDRVSFALQSRHKRQFIEDVRAVDGNTPVIFSRSPQAWESHPRNYRDIEQYVTRVGELLFGKTLDFAWCHLAIRGSQLGKIIGGVGNHDLSMVAEIVFAIRETARMQAVDWLEWEDPFLLHRDAQDLKRERDESIEETQKRLSYTIPMLQTLMERVRE